MYFLYDQSFLYQGELSDVLKDDFTSKIHSHHIPHKELIRCRIRMKYCESHIYTWLLQILPSEPIPLVTFSYRWMVVLPEVRKDIIFRT